MTSTPVMGSEILFQANLMNQTSKNNKNGLGDFKDFMNQSQKDGLETSVNKETPKMISKGVLKNEPKIKQDVETKMEGQEAAWPIEKANEAELTQSFENAIEELKNVIKQELGVSDEDIVEALETLGLTFAGLLDPQMLPQIVATITNLPDAVSIVTNENLYEALSNITDKAEEIISSLSENMNVPAEEFETAIKQAEIKPAMLNDDSQAVNLTEVPSDSMENDDVELTVYQQKESTTVADNNQKLEEKITINDNRNNEASENAKIVKSSRSVTQGDNFKATENSEVGALKVEKQEPEKNKGFSFNNETREDNAFSAFVDRVINKAVESLNDKAGAEGFTLVDPKNVLNQITESIRFDLNNEVNEVNLRLHPETLGTVNVKVTSNAEGVMTAQFTAQNEQVKAIIENQAVVLKETLEAKGVTVQAVEVLVQSHEFERNLNEQNKGQEQNTKGSRKIRRINLDDIEDDQMTEEDTVIRQMMLQNGNTVDYSA